MTDSTKKGKRRFKGFSEFERSAIKERAQELLADENKGEAALLVRLEEMPEPDRMMAKRVHTLIIKSAPDLTPKTWYGMPAYADQNGKVICFFQGAAKFKARYATFGFNDTARLDEGAMWPTSFAIKELTEKVEARIVELVKKAVSD